MVKVVIAFIAAFCLTSSCDQWRSPNYYIEKRSPNGDYLVKVNVNESTAKGTRAHTEVVTITFLKRNELIHTYQSEQSSQYEPSFLEMTPIIEWVDASILRMGEGTSEQPFHDELIVSNDTAEHFRYVSLSYGRYETFWIFDLPPHGRATLLASPRFKPDGSSNWFLGVGGETKDGRKCELAMELKKRASSAEGPLKFNIMIEPKDLK